MAEIKVNEKEADANESDEVEEELQAEDFVPPEPVTAGFSIQSAEEDAAEASRRKKNREDLEGAADEEGQDVDPEGFYAQYLEFAASYAVMFGGADALAIGNFIDPALSRDAGNLSLKASRKFDGDAPLITAKIKDAATGKENFYHFSQKGALADVGAPGGNLTVEQAFLVTSAARANESLRNAPLRADGNEYNRYLLVMLAQDKKLFQGQKPLNILHAKHIIAQTPKEIRQAVQRDIAEYKALKGLDNKAARTAELQKFSDDIRANQDQIKAKLARMKQNQHANQEAHAKAAQEMAEEAVKEDAAQEKGADQAGGDEIEQAEEDDALQDEQPQDEDEVQVEASEHDSAGDEFKKVAAEGAVVAGGAALLTDEGLPNETSLPVIQSGAVVDPSTLDSPATTTDLIVTTQETPALIGGSAEANSDDDTGSSGGGVSEDLDASYADLVDGPEEESRALPLARIEGKTEAKGDFETSASDEPVISDEEYEQAGIQRMSEEESAAIRDGDVIEVANVSDENDKPQKGTSTPGLPTSKV